MLISSFNIGLNNPLTGVADAPEKFAELLNNVVSMIVALAGFALFAYLLSGGLQYITAGGDPKAVESAKKTITNAITGIVIMGAAFLLVRILSFILGTELNILTVGGN